MEKSKMMEGIGGINQFWWLPTAPQNYISHILGFADL